MSSADFSNFGSAALGIAGTAYVVGETTKMLRNAERQARPMRTKRMPKKMKHESHRKEHHNHGWEFDFKL